MVVYTTEQWRKSRWDLSNIHKDISCFDKFPDLRQDFKLIEAAYYKNGGIDIPFEQLVRYIVVVYHKGSPYAINEQNIIARKIDACEFVGMDTADNDVKRIIANQNEFVNNAVIWFLKMEANIPWLELQTYLEAYYQIMGALTDGREDTSSKGPVDNARTKLTIVKEMKAIKSEIDALSNQIFGQDNDLLNHVERYKEAEKENFIVIVPEDYAKMKNGQEV